MKSSRLASLLGTWLAVAGKRRLRPPALRPELIRESGFIRILVTDAEPEGVEDEEEPLPGGEPGAWSPRPAGLDL